MQSIPNLTIAIHRRSDDPSNKTAPSRPGPAAPHPDALQACSTRRLAYAGGMLLSTGAAVAAALWWSGVGALAGSIVGLVGLGCLAIDYLGAVTQPAKDGADPVMDTITSFGRGVLFMIDLPCQSWRWIVQNGNDPRGGDRRL